MRTCLAILVVLTVLGGPAHAEPTPSLAGHRGVTFEIAVGGGRRWVPTTDVLYTSRRVYLPAGAIAIGGFVRPSLAITLRITGTLASCRACMDEGSGAPDLALFVGPSVQYWPHRMLWVAGGIGHEAAERSVATLDLRAGFAIADAITVQVEAQPSVYTDGTHTTSLWLLFGYQHM